MSIVLPALGVAFAAFCVWLGVRIFNRRERWAKRTAVWMVALLVIYPLSSGPAVWIDIKFISSPGPQWLRATIGQLYVPLFAALDCGPEWIKELSGDYVGWWAESAQPKFDELPEHL